MYAIIKRVFDILFSCVALIAVLPVAIIAAVGILISDPGPVFYVADRVGKNNKHFKMYKFRSMRIAKGADERSLRPDQSRIFTWGRMMRDTKIDELPQLINVLFGEMSVIGPRPASADQVETTRGGENEAISTIKPGLSGPSALYDYLYGDAITDEIEYEKSVLPTRLALDLYYLNMRSVKYDLKMIWWTALAILFRGQRNRILYELTSAVSRARV